MQRYFKNVIHRSKLFNKYVMKRNFLLIKIFVIYLFLVPNGITKQPDYFDRGLELFQKKEFDKSKILFEQDIVFNPKNEESYLYLAKIFNEKNKDDEEDVPF